MRCCFAGASASNPQPLGFMQFPDPYKIRNSLYLTESFITQSLSLLDGVRALTLTFSDYVSNSCAVQRPLQVHSGALCAHLLSTFCVLRSPIAVNVVMREDLHKMREQAKYNGMRGQIRRLKSEFDNNLKALAIAKR